LSWFQRKAVKGALVATHRIYRVGREGRIMEMTQIEERNRYLKGEGGSMNWMR